MSNTTLPQLGDTKKGHVFTETGWTPTKPPKKKRTFLKVFLALCAFGVISTVGFFALLGAGANEVAKSIEENANKPGGDSNPLAITEGKAFEVDNFNYADGWNISKDAFGYAKVSGLKVTNNRDTKDSALVEIKFWKGTEVLALSDCTTEPIAVGTTTSLDCTGMDKLPKSYDKVTINDTF